MDSVLRDERDFAQPQLLSCPKNARWLFHRENGVYRQQAWHAVSRRNCGRIPDTLHTVDRRPKNTGRGNKCDHVSQFEAWRLVDAIVMAEGVFTPGAGRRRLGLWPGAGSPDGRY